MEGKNSRTSGWWEAFDITKGIVNGLTIKTGNGKKRWLVSSGELKRKENLLKRNPWTHGVDQKSLFA